jgi:hypothetical protein
MSGGDPLLQHFMLALGFTGLSTGSAQARPCPSSPLTGTIAGNLTIPAGCNVALQAAVVTGTISGGGNTASRGGAGGRAAVLLGWRTGAARPRGSSQQDRRSRGLGAPARPASVLARPLLP